MSKDFMPQIHPMAVVHRDAELADDVVIGPFAYIGANVRLGRGGIVHHHASVQGVTTAGAHNVFYSNCVIGMGPQDLKYRGGNGRVLIWDSHKFREIVT